mgnify:FL=1
MKEQIKSFLRIVGYILHRNRDSKVIYYHDLGVDYTEMGTDFNVFASHIEIVRSLGFSLVDRITKKKDEVMVCFDDGWLGIYSHRDFFKKQGFFPTIFIAVDLIGTEGFLTSSQILDMQKEGFHFECHSWTHTGLPDHYGEDLVHEVGDSKNYLENLLGHKISGICFPQGRFNKDVIAACEKAEYSQMYSSLNGSFYRLQNENLICRNLLQDVPDKDVKYILLGDSVIQRMRLRRLHTL